VGWQTGLRQLATESTLLDISAWLGGVLLTYATIRGAQRLTYYNAVRVVDIRQRLKDRAGKKRTTAMAAPVVQDAYTISRVRDNRLKPIRIGERYQCPVCEKIMSKQGWSKHPCRFDDTFTEVDGNRRLVDEVDAVDGQLGQVSVNGVNAASTIQQLASYGKSNAEGS